MEEAPHFLYNFTSQEANINNLKAEVLKVLDLDYDLFFVVGGSVYYFLNIIFILERKKPILIEDFDSIVEKGDYPRMVELIGLHSSRYINKKNDRKVRNRFLEIFEKGEIENRKLQFSDFIIIITQENSGKVRPRMEEMVGGGGLEEIRKAFKLKEGGRGVFQSIGYKEFGPFIQNESPQILKLCLDNLEKQTLRLIKMQKKFIRTRILQEPLFKSKIYQNVKFEDLVEQFVGSSIQLKPSEIQQSCYFECQQCNLIFNQEMQLQFHNKKRHGGLGKS